MYASNTTCRSVVAPSTAIAGPIAPSTSVIDAMRVVVFLPLGFPARHPLPSVVRPPAPRRPGTRERVMEVWVPHYSSTVTKRAASTSTGLARGRRASSLLVALFLGYRGLFLSGQPPGRPAIARATVAVEPPPDAPAEGLLLERLAVLPSKVSRSGFAPRCFGSHPRRASAFTGCHRPGMEVCWPQRRRRSRGGA